MPATAPKLANVFFEDQHPAAGDSRAELVAGLQRPQKQIKPKYLYDARGSELFEQITLQQEYYPTRTEMAILNQHAAEIAVCCGDDCVLIEPGSGSSEKVRLILHAAYNDAKGVTAEFNLNILNSINKYTGANFNPENFYHQAFYNQELKRIAMHLVSKKNHTVDIEGSAIAFDKGESLHTENSYKYSMESFTSLCNAAGFVVTKSWLDEEELFSVHYLTVGEQPI